MEMHWWEKQIVNSRLWNWLYARTLLPRFTAFAGNAIHGKVLEIGCGSGKTSMFLQQRYSGMTLIALDYDPDQIRLAKMIHQPNVTFVRGDATRLSFGRASFDTVVQLLAFHHIKEYQQAIREAYRVLKPGGCLVMMDLGNKLFNRLVHLFFSSDALFTKEEMAHSLEEAGFRAEKERERAVFMIIARKPKG